MMTDQSNELLKQIVRNTENTTVEIGNLRREYHAFQLMVTKEIERIDNSPKLTRLEYDMENIRSQRPEWLEWRECVERDIAKHDKYFFAFGIVILLLQFVAPIVLKVIGIDL